MEKNSALRKEADDIILQIWNEVEKSHFELPEETRKIRNEEYGLIYFYRKNELLKSNTREARDSVMTEQGQN